MRWYTRVRRDSSLFAQRSDGATKTIYTDDILERYRPLDSQEFRTDLIRIHFRHARSVFSVAMAPSVKQCYFSGWGDIDGLERRQNGRRRATASCMKVLEFRVLGYAIFLRILLSKFHTIRIWMFRVAFSGYPPC